MAFGIKRADVDRWKAEMERGEISFLTHYWLDDRFPGCTTVTKVGSCDIDKLVEWGSQYGLKKQWLHYRDDGTAHFDLFGEFQRKILIDEHKEEFLWNQKN